MENEIIILKNIGLNAADVRLRNDGIIQFLLKPNLTVNLNDAKEIVVAAGEVGEGKKYPILISAGEYTLVDSEVRAYAASEVANKYTIAGAIVIKNLAQKLLGNAYIKFNRPVTPTQLFNSETEAVKWLKTFI